MSKNSLELKDFVNDPTFIENMNRAFSDLRADYELSMDSTCEKINELKSTLLYRISQTKSTKYKGFVI